MLCKECKRDLPSDQYYRPKKKGYKVKFCNDCASAKMAKYMATHHVGRQVNEYANLEK